MRILILGPQGSGKGTQAQRIAAAYAVPHIATGDMFRAAVAAGSEVGAQVGPILERGDLVPDDLTIELIRGRTAPPAPGRRGRVPAWTVPRGRPPGPGRWMRCARRSASRSTR